MPKGSRKFMAGFTALCIVLVQALFTYTALGRTTSYSKTDRLSGRDRYETAAAISKKGWPNGSRYAIVATGEKFADALCAGPLAMKYDAPILLTESSRLSSDTLMELRRLEVENVIIVGGYKAVSSSLEGSIEREGIDVERIYGRDRYETSVKIAKELGDAEKIVVATGIDFPDALSISPIAAKMGMPILLTEKNKLPYDVRSYINDSHINTTYVIGGAGVISEEVKRLLPHPDRIGGGDRYETNVEVMEKFENILDFSRVYVAIGGGPKGNEFADALAGAVLAAKTSSPLVLAYKALPRNTGNYVKNKVSPGSEVVALGGTNSISTSVVSTLAEYVEDGTFHSAGSSGASSPSIDKVSAVEGTTRAGDDTFYKTLSVGQPYMLPDSVTVTMSDDTTRQRNVIWAAPQGVTIDGGGRVAFDSVGEYTFTGSVSGYSHDVMLKLSVKAPIVISWDEAGTETGPSTFKDVTAGAIKDVVFYAVPVEGLEQPDDIAFVLTWQAGDEASFSDIVDIDNASTIDESRWYLEAEEGCRQSIRVQFDKAGTYTLTIYGVKAD